MQPNPQQKGMDLFGKAIYNYGKGNRTPLYFIYGGMGDSRKYPKDLFRYYRSFEQLTPLEQKLIKLAKGNILDIGCATGYYIPYLKQQGTADAIDLSPTLIQACKEKGLQECHLADIFTYNPPTQYDTITMLENNLGLGGTIEKTRQLLTKMHSLLKEDGRVLMVQVNFDQDYLESEITAFYKDEQEAFLWLYTSKDFTRNLCEQAGFKFRALAEKKSEMYLAELTKA